MNGLVFRRGISRQASKILMECSFGRKKYEENLRFFVCDKTIDVAFMTLLYI